MTPLKKRINMYCSVEEPKSLPVPTPTQYYNFFKLKNYGNFQIEI